jgi:hypothetical protein
MDVTVTLKGEGRLLRQLAQSAVVEQEMRRVANDTIVRGHRP